jgi:phosphatidylinositol-3-phosphatase
MIRGMSFTASSFWRSSFRRCSSTVAAFLILLASVGCSLSSAGAPRPTPPPTPTGTVPQFGHVVLVVEENSSYSEVIGSSEMPYLNSLAKQYGLATQYFANAHPSIGDYFMLTTGQIVTNKDSFTGRVDVDNIVRELVASGKTWKSYAESRGDQLSYARWHDPLSYFSDVMNSPAQTQNLTSWSQFGRDLTNNVLPNFSFVVPNIFDDGHSGTLQVADRWLQHNMAPLISNAIFQKDGLLIIVFDEAATSDATNGGGHVAALIISAKARQGFQSTTLYQHQSTLRLILQGLGVANLPGASSAAPEMGEFF